MVVRRVGALALVMAGVVASGLYFWIPHLLLLLAGVFVAGMGISWLVGVSARTPVQTAERALIRAIWALARRAPSRELLPDPVTGDRIGVDRRWGLLSLVVADRPDADGAFGETALVTWYMLGSFARPSPPPLLRRHGPVDDEGADAVSWGQARSMLRFNDVTGAMDASSDELVDLHSKVRRAFGAG